MTEKAKSMCWERKHGEREKRGRIETGENKKQTKVQKIQQANRSLQNNK
jgi:hypothetical protein